MERCALFVDAGYLLADGAMAVHGTRHRESVSWDFGGLLQLLGNLARERSGMSLLRCYWYESSVEGRRGPEHEALADLPGLKLRLGRSRSSGRGGVDTELNRDLMTLARNKGIADAVIVSGDEDLATVIADAQDLGMRVTIVHVAVDGNWTISRVLRQECDDLIEISSGHLRPYVNLLSGIDRGGESGLSPLSNGHGSNGSPLASLQSSIHSSPTHTSPPPSSPLTPPPALPQPQLAAPVSAPLNSPANILSGIPYGTQSQAQPQAQPAAPSYLNPPLGSPAPPPSSSSYSTGSQSYSTGSSSSPYSTGSSPSYSSGLPSALNPPPSSPQTSSLPVSNPAPGLGGLPSSYATPPPAQPQHGPYTGPQPLPAQSAPAPGPSLSDAVKAAHTEGQDFGESVARDAPALWLEAVLARKPRMPSDLEARLLQGSALPIDFLLHDEVRHALRRGFWDALERSRR
ncbi:NYN domain-containing protein [Actinocorallia longicatena]|uniref:NYN domain-containing protein n=1 Tax=Actinocorallia longicatena TaxID=111803 RepID=A0ABP6QLD7_9ACTN